jgi:hypothetical protein
VLQVDAPGLPKGPTYKEIFAPVPVGITDSEARPALRELVRQRCLLLEVRVVGLAVPEIEPPLVGDILEGSRRRELVNLPRLASIGVLILERDLLIYRYAA